MMLKVILADGDVDRRRELASRLRELPGVEEVKEVSDAAGMDAAGPDEADLLVVDVDLPGLEWREAVRSLAASTFVVPVMEDADGMEAAYDEGAFDVMIRQAVRLREIVQRASNALRALGVNARPGGDARPLAVPNTIIGGSGYVAKFLARSGPRIYFVDADHVLWIRAAGNYVELHTPDGHHLVRVTLSTLDPRLDPSRFRRIHRSTIVSLDAVSEVRSDGHGQYVVALSNGVTLQLTRTFRDNLLSGRA